MSASNAPSARRPIEVKRGNVTVKIYRTINHVGGVDYHQFTLAYYQGDSRVRRRFSDLDAAKREAELVATKLANGENEVLRLTPADRAIYVQAADLLRPFGRPLNLAVAEYVEALALLPSGTSLKQAVADFGHRQRSIHESRMIPDLVAEFIATKQQAGRSQRHLADLRTRLTRFGEAFRVPTSSITGRLIQEYLDALPVGNRSKLNDMRLIVSLLRFAVRRRYAPRDLLDELEGVEKPEVRPTETLIFTPDELREMLSAIRAELVPWLAVAAFCGLRTAEILRLDWRQVNLQRKFVEVKAGNAKTAARRLVPLCDAAISWLTPHAREEGRLAYYTEENKFHASILSDVNRARKDAGNCCPFQWKRNGLRHSFCSYRLALTNDAAKTALEAGNSAAMVFRHYRELVTEAEAKTWFGIFPPTGQSNVVSLPLSATA